MLLANFPGALPEIKLSKLSKIELWKEIPKDQWNLMRFQESVTFLFSISELYGSQDIYSHLESAQEENV